MHKITITLILNFLFLFEIFAQDLLVFETESLPKPDSVFVFLPETYSTSSDIRYPTLYLLHGWSGNYIYWNEIIDCQAYANDYQMIIVCPDGLYNSWYINSPVIENCQYANFFFQELVPKIFQNYHADSNNVFITGLSMGGHGALYLFAQKPEIFRSAGSISGTFDLKLVPSGLGIAQKLGMAKNRKIETLYDEYSVIGNIDKIKLANKPIIFSCGVSDQYYEVNDVFGKLCKENQIEATFIADPGEHNALYWRKAIKYHFIFFSDLVQ